ncbi:phosphoglycerate mutase [Thalassoporum mexicanum PCC 7367]|uniref:2,3-bisphosphoglycerate-independent phosphoglycerate mutase n=1 Tax=Thalassoporum mexicanum TaxID=3457544 RepID=UPI00029F9E78|nr:2,3-bisphosphoglycerate-independent phosphoglycerate mutase [Pseudanabaena sp. PCC 7367]AFY68826.1 phosphoglycerate mutase [Pseudanabaena sp. PCC 7367]
MSTESVSPVVLVILDGWGYREEVDGNAIAAANTPIMDSLWQAYPKTLLQASGKDVGLPRGQMGNSEVGHISIGAGRIVPQELVRISDAVEDGTIASNSALLNVCTTVKANGGKLHLIGLCSDGGVHSHLDHLLGLLDMVKSQGLERVCIHAITDGRDTLPRSGISHLTKLQNYVDRIGVGQIVTVMGRYFAMDRDKRWDRVQKAYEVMVSTDTESITASSAVEILEKSYANDITDEFVEPVRIAPGAIEPNDGIIFFNFRPDRAREITQALMADNFTGFEREQVKPLSFVSLTQYDASLDLDVAFLPQSLDNLLGQVVASHGLRQFRTAETEKYAHVTYFMDGGNEEPSPGDDRLLVNSPRVSTYDQQPEMSANAVANAVVEAIDKRYYSLVVVNFANPDMVGHTGNFEATVNALGHIDTCVGRVIEAASNSGGVVLITADHGNAEYMHDQDGKPWTAHTTNPVPFIMVESEGIKIPGGGGEVKLRSGGRLADIAPTILDILQIPKPEEMSGESLIVPSDYTVSKQRTPVKIRA